MEGSNESGEDEGLLRRSQALEELVARLNEAEFDDISHLDISDLPQFMRSSNYEDLRASVDDFRALSAAGRTHDEWSNGENKMDLAGCGPPGDAEQANTGDDSDGFSSSLEDLQINDLLRSVKSINSEAESVRKKILEEEKALRRMHFENSPRGSHTKEIRSCINRTIQKGQRTKAEFKLTQLIKYLPLLEEKIRAIEARKSHDASFLKL